MEGTINHENECDGVVDTEHLEGSVPEITSNQAKKGFNSMKSGKASGKSGVINEYFLLSSHDLEALYDIANEILRGHGMPED